MTDSQLTTTAVVTVTYNSSNALAPFLESVGTASRDRLTVVVADNHSVDVRETESVSLGHGARLLKLSRNLGYGGAINAAIGTLPASINRILVSNPDVFLGPKSIDILNEVLDRNPRAAAVGPLVLNSDGSVYPSARALPSLRDGIGHALFVGIWPANPWTRHYRQEQESSNVERRAGWLSGSCLLIRRCAFEDVKGFDESFFMYFEDVDLGYRFAKAGWVNIYSPIAHVTHTGAHSTSSDPALMIKAHHRSTRLYLNRRYPARILAPLRLILRSGLMVREWILVCRARRDLPKPPTA